MRQKVLEKQQELIKTYVVNQMPKADRKTALGSDHEIEPVGEGPDQENLESHESEDEQINKR